MKMLNSIVVGAYGLIAVLQHGDEDGTSIKKPQHPQKTEGNHWHDPGINEMRCECTEGICESQVKWMLGGIPDEVVARKVILIISRNTP